MGDHKQYMKPYINKLFAFLIISIFFLLPIQTRIVKFSSDSFTGNSYSFYGTLFIYLTDILSTLVIVIWLIKAIFSKFHVKLWKIVVICLVISILLIFSIVSHETNLTVQSLYAWKLIVSLVLLCFMANSNILKNRFNAIIWAILAISIIEIALETIQYFTQQSLGLKFLGEEYLRVGLPGIASYKTIDGSKWIFDRISNVYHETLIMRPYGTFPHPNILGSFLGFSALLSQYLISVSRETWKRGTIAAILMLQIFGLFMAFSRVAIFGWIFSTLIFLFIMKHKKIDFPLRKICTFLIFCVILTITLFWPAFIERSGIVSYGTTNYESISDRILYQNIALSMIKSKPAFGVGFHNFVDQMDNYSSVKLKDYQHQPVHNIYLLIASETGLTGLLLFLLLIGIILNNARKCLDDPKILALTSIFIGFLAIGMFDHYLLTLQQGRLMFFLTAGLLSGASVSGEIKNPLKADTALSTSRQGI